MEAALLKKKKITAISLGCDKNRVDLERILGSLRSFGFEIVPTIDEADICVINTCAFILPARQESVMEILNCIKAKKDGILEKVIITGCLPEKSMDELKGSLPEVDAFVNVRDNGKIVNIIEKLYDSKKSNGVSFGERLLTTRPHFAYLKIADGCNNACAYCTIPRIRGRYISEKIEDVLKEAKNLVSRGVKELIIVAQDSTRYGEDLYGANRFVELLKELCKIKELVWIRLLYCYPEKISEELLLFINSNPKICKYLDMPLQHIDDEILKNMRRRLPEKESRALVELIKGKYPEIKIRSTFIVGFPGETKKQFLKLCSFLKNYKLDFVGFFPYSKEEGTRAFYMRKQVPKIIKKMRLKKVQEIQTYLMAENAEKYLGKTFKTLIDDFDSESGEFIGHTEFLTPDADCLLKIADSGKIEIGKFYDVTFVRYSNYEFKGEIKA